MDRKFYPTKSIKVLKEVGYLKMFIYLFMAAFRILGVPDGFLSPIPKSVDRQRVVISIDSDDDDDDPPRSQRSRSNRSQGSPRVKTEVQNSSQSSSVESKGPPNVKAEPASSSSSFHPSGSSRYRDLFESKSGSIPGQGPPPL